MQILIDKTNLTPARILVCFVTAGAILTALGIYDPIVEFGGAGATVPLPGFGYALAKGAIKGVKELGVLGAFTGGVTATAGGITAAIVFGYLAAVLFDPRKKLIFKRDGNPSLLKNIFSLLFTIIITIIIITVPVIWRVIIIIPVRWVRINRLGVWLFFFKLLFYSAKYIFI